MSLASGDWLAAFTALIAPTLLCALPVRAAPAPGVTFTRIADTSTIIPAGQWAGEKFKGFGIPSIDNGNVVFLGVPDSATGGDNGVYGWKNGALGLVADPSVPHPSGGTLREFREPSIRGDTVAFRTEAGGSSIFRASGGVVTSIGTMPVTRFSSPSVDGDDTWFYGYSFGPGPLGGVIDGGVYRARNGSFERVVADGQAAPSLPPGYTLDFRHTTMHRTIGVSGTAVFWGISSKPGSPEVTGLYRYDALGAVDRIVDSTMLAPGASEFFGDFHSAAFDFDGESTAFRNAVGYTQGLYVARDGAVQLIAQSGQPAPGGGIFTFTGYSEIAIENGNVAFSEGPDPIGLPSAIYTNVDGSLRRVIGAGDTLFGSTITKVQLGPDSISGSRVAFFAWLSGGGYGVYVATVPEPSLAGYAGVASIAYFVARRYRGDQKRDAASYLHSP